MQTTDISAAAYAHFDSLQYKMVPGFPLLTQDPTLLFVNSSIAPFKPLLLQGEALPKTGIVQPCFRNHSAGGGLFAFSMLGLLGDLEYMESIQDDFIRFLTEVLQLQKEKLHAVLDAGDKDLWSYCRSRFPAANIHRTTGNTGKYSTRWGFGEGARLMGCGLTLVIESSATAPCGVDCSVFCMCSRFFPLGNFIIVYAAAKQKAYIELGFGLEGLAAALHGNSYYHVDPYPQLISGFKQLGFDAGQSLFLARHLAGAAALLKEPVQVSNRGAGYVLKKMIRSLFEMVLLVYDDGVAFRHCIECIGSLPVLQHSPVYRAYVELLKNEAPKYLSTIESGKGRLKKWIGSLPSGPPDANLVHRFKATYGLPESVISSCLLREP